MATHPLRLGYKASAEQFGPRQLLDFTTEAEERGFDSVWISDHFQPWRHTNGHAPFALSWLGAVGERTSRIELGTSVLTPTFRYQPAVVAQAFGTLGALYPGRIILGAGGSRDAQQKRRGKRDSIDGLHAYLPVHLLWGTRNDRGSLRPDRRGRSQPRRPCHPDHKAERPDRRGAPLQ